MSIQKTQKEATFHPKILVHLSELPGFINPEMRESGMSG